MNKKEIFYSNKINFKVYTNLYFNLMQFKIELFISLFQSFLLIKIFWFI